ncbi:MULTISPECIES: 16S rRNA (guanine(966)-N(2))-methyltransferase RsmD [Colwellia]|uniref:Ribosomal RNA small subunit methyltransferase D n=1 Tax=Colwellia psychrerythraea (strain 34H / ATCC BAA-681) TaxID=167879 RepID=Q48AI9_COLP3|nr:MULTISPECIES: 16S rRNA (guanine(966)-N(2))-methyltransferase RsmD [Colwellia]AAZ26323.1 putative methyltransferase [Colwellia psychrerythraea 34H]PKH88343.1 16S rRNA (guanine(966)-N(2))-methyltransferase RsmD [Colwellia sp. Bg11-28]
MNQAKKQLSKKLLSGRGQGKSAGKIRIIAGKYKGRKLPVLMAEGLRPTTDRVKETVFNWLMPYIAQANCLDCFAGSGSLGFEALSRGADEVTLVELNRAAANQLLENKDLLKADNINVINDNALVFLKKDPLKVGLTAKSDKPFDLVFLDPPFRKQLVEQTAQLLNHFGLADQALIYVEMEADSTQVIPANWQLIKEKISGQVVYQLYQYQG